MIQHLMHIDYESSNKIVPPKLRVVSLSLAINMKILITIKEKWIITIL
jgi:hypothetical protein